MPRLVALIPLLIAVVLPAPAGAATWTATSTIAPAADTQFALSMGADGTAALAYARGGIRVAVKRPGHAWSTPRRVDQGDFQTARPDVAVTGRGEVVVAWAQAGSHSGATRGPLTVRARARGTNGAWGAVRQIGTTGHFLEAKIQLAANARGEAIAVWRGTARVSRTRRTEALQSAFRRPASAFGSTQTVREPEQQRAISGGVVALDEQSRAYAAWTSSSVVRMATRGRGAAGSWGTARTIGAKPASNPAIAVTPGGTAVMAWRAAQIDTEGGGVQEGPLDSAARLPGGQLTAVQRMSTSPTRTYGLAVSAQGEVALTWVAENVLHAAFRPPAGGPFRSTQTIAGVSPFEFHTNAAYLADGTLLYAYGQADRVRVIQSGAGGSFASAPELDRPGAYPLVAAAGARAVTTWTTIGSEVPLLSATRTG